MRCCPRVLVQHPGDGLQPVVVWFRQLQWLLVRLVEFVDEDSAQAGAGGAVVVRGAVVVARAREGEQDFAGEVGGHEHGGMAWYEPGQGCRQEDDPHVGVAVSAVVVREPGGGPGDSIGGNDRGAALGVHRQDAAGRVHQVSTSMGVHRSSFPPTATDVRLRTARGVTSGRLGRLAANGHSLAFYRWPATPPSGDSDSAISMRYDDASGGLCQGGWPGGAGDP